MESVKQIEVWLKKLEQESWQLELLVSGFTIFLLQMAYQAIGDYGDSFEFHHQSGNIFFTIAVLLLSGRLSLWKNSSKKWKQITLTIRIWPSSLI